MAAQINLPFGIHSLVPELSNIPKLRIIPPKEEPPVPTVLRLSEDSRAAIGLHIEQVGLDRHRFEYTVKGQREITYN